MTPSPIWASAGAIGIEPRNTPLPPVRITFWAHGSVLDVTCAVTGPDALVSMTSISSVSLRPYWKRSSATAPAGPPTPPVMHSANGCGPWTTRRPSTRIVQRPAPGVASRTSSSTFSESRVPPAAET